ncbi:AraC family transcriptional regulator [Exiguobacterium sp. MMG028]|uniref:helix-turn-helix domain-containing protein n=1 Tax=Exiguobacterium sp. MMG028 TaxID=3021979 RepID=UPI0022FE06F2|nr:AraC family transcriptional regulator [Exiguobacterium sp. MMG028]MDA5560947.1 AraC family transcriptional regulator [Exiguobacterium sp. MMG028]
MENRIRQQFLTHLAREKNHFIDQSYVENFYELDEQIIHALQSNQLQLANTLLETLTLDLLKHPMIDEHHGLRLYFRGLIYHVSRLVPASNSNVQTSLAYTSALLKLMDELHTPLDFVYAIPVITESLATMMSFISSQGSSDPRVLSAIRLIEEHLTDSFLSLSSVAIKVGLSNNYLSVLFKQETGETIAERIRRRRIEASMNDLIVTSLPICEIAKSYCFSSCTTFISTFKTYKNMTPLQYRQSHHKKKR